MVCRWQEGRLAQVTSDGGGSVAAAAAVAIPVVAVAAMAEARTLARWHVIEGGHISRLLVDGRRGVAR